MSPGRGIPRRAPTCAAGPARAATRRPTTDAIPSTVPRAPHRVHGRVSVRHLAGKVSRRREFTDKSGVAANIEFLFGAPRYFRIPFRRISELSNIPCFKVFVF